MAVIPTVPGPFSDGTPFPEHDYLAILCRSGVLCGFLSIRLTALTSGQGVLRRGSTREVIRWRISLDPSTPWDEGYQSVEEATNELANEAFTYAGEQYAVQWVDETLAHWISAAVLSD